MNSSNADSSHQPLLSVIIPCYNVADWVGDALDSILVQDIEHYEVIAVDDGSRDATVSVLNKWKEENPDTNMQIVEQANSGACAARNKGLKLAQGEFVQFLDADDILLPNKLQRQIELLNNHPKAAFVAGAFARVALDGSKQNCVPANPGYFSVFAGLAGITSANLFRKEAVDTCEGWKTGLGSSQEAELMFRILMQFHHYVCDNKVLTEIRERPSGRITQSDPFVRMKNYLDVRIAMYDEFKVMHPEEWKGVEMEMDSFLVSTIVLMDRLRPGCWKEYRKYLVEPDSIRPIAGISQLKINAIKVLGYSRFFRLSRVLPRPIM